jgi:hypothetical protein
MVPVALGYVVGRCRALGVTAAVYAPSTPNGAAVAPRAGDMS